MFRFLLFLGSIGIGITAQAGALFTMADQTPGSQETVEFAVEGESLTMNTDDDSTMIFRGDQDRMVVIDHREKSYMVMDKSTAQKLVNEIGPALEEMRKELERMPPEQRAMVEKMMGGRLSMASEPPPKPVWTVEKTGESGEQADIGCRWASVAKDGVVTQRVCLADFDDVPGAEEAMDGMRAMGVLFEEIMAPLQEKIPFQMPESPMIDVDKMGGFPIITQELKNGAVTGDFRLQSAEEATIAAERFEPPKDYQRRDMDF